VQPTAPGKFGIDLDQNASVIAPQVGTAGWLRVDLIWIKSGPMWAPPDGTFPGGTFPGLCKITFAGRKNYGTDLEFSRWSNIR
jgi:hypothetical protein